MFVWVFLTFSKIFDLHFCYSNRIYINKFVKSTFQFVLVFLSSQFQQRTFTLQIVELIGETI